MITLDFETEAIVGNPLLNPPKPVGLAIKVNDNPGTYITDWEGMGKYCHKVIGKVETLYQNAPFDLSVAHHWFDVPWPRWDMVHDTMYLLYLADPYAKTFSLKPSAERYLGITPQPQTDLKHWVMSNVPKATEKNWGAYISKAPVELVEPYAIEDVTITHALFKHLHPDTPKSPYDRERRLMPILRNATVRGIRVARPQLEQALELYRGAFEQVDRRIGTYLQAPNLNPGSGPQLAQALASAGQLEEIVYTPKGAISTAMKTLKIKDPALRNMLKYRSTLKTLLGTFIEPWLEFSQWDGRVHPNWNSTRGDRDGGTRTGRLSSNQPNFQNVPNTADVAPIEGLPDLPHMRDFVLPEEGHVWIKRDFSAQEIRHLAHFERGALAEAFRADPHLDPHNMVREAIKSISGVEYPRKYVKETGFGILYGMGVSSLADRLGVKEQEARELVRLYKQAIPGVDKLQRGTKNRGRTNQPIRTWGGRLIYCEEPKVVNGRMRSFEYKLLNYLIQGSSADQTKECIIHWNGTRSSSDVFMATVHDEINISAPEEEVAEAAERLRVSMEDVCEFEVPMKSELYTGKNWGECE